MPPAHHPTPSAERRNASLWRWLAVALVVVGLFTVFPPFRVISLDRDATTSASAATFDPVAFASTFWAKQLQPAAASAPAMTPLLADLRRDPAAAAKAHGHQVGLGNAVYYFARGSGRVTAIEKSRLLVAIGDAVVAVRTGPVFGNVVRDGCGLLEVNAVPGLQEFNAISAELNRLVEERIQPTLRAGVTVGAKITFAGCAEAPESIGPGPLLTFIPVEASITP